MLQSSKPVAGREFVADEVRRSAHRAQGYTKPCCVMVESDLDLRCCLYWRTSYETTLQWRNLLLIIGRVPRTVYTNQARSTNEWICISERCIEEPCKSQLPLTFIFSMRGSTLIRPHCPMTTFWDALRPNPRYRESQLQISRYSGRGRSQLHRCSLYMAICPSCFADDRFKSQESLDNGP